MATIPTPSFISIKEQSCVFNKDGCFKFFVPEKYFDTKLAEIRGEYVNLFGVCTYAIYDKNDKLISKLKNFNLPVMFLTKPDEIEVMKNVKLTKNTDEQDYRVLKYYRDGVVIVNYEISENADNLDTWYRALQYGNLPNTIPYNELQDYFIRNIGLTGNSYNVSLQLIGVIFSEQCRSRSDSTKPFRLTKDTDMTNYRLVNIREVARNVSPFTAFTSENWDEALINAITTDSDKESPLERIMMD